MLRCIKLPTVAQVETFIARIRCRHVFFLQLHSCSYSIQFDAKIQLTIVLYTSLLLQVVANYYSVLQLNATINHRGEKEYSYLYDIHA